MTTSSAPVQRILEKLDRVRPSGKGWEARCPAHADNRASLSISVGKEDSALLTCHANCSTDAVIAALGLTWRDLFAESRSPLPSSRQQGRRIASTYDYVDAAGVLRFQVVRYEPKGFAQRRPDGSGGWEWSLNGTQRVLYRLPEVLAAVERGEPIYLVEGEKDSDALVQLGLTATTNAQGAGKWQAHYAESLRGAEVVVLPDNDEPGRQHAGEVARTLRGVASSITVVPLPCVPPKGDVSDWLSLGGTRESLEELVRIARGRAAPLADGPIYLTMHDVEPEHVSWLSPGRIPLGKLTVLEGHPNLGKTMVLVDLAARLSRGEGWFGDPAIPAADSVILTGEDGLADTIRPRLDAAGANLKRIRALTGKQQEGKESSITLPDDVDQIRQVVERTGAKLVIIDVLNAYLSSGVDAYRDHDIRRALVPLKQLAEATGCAVVCVRHLNKRTAGARGITAGGGSIGIAGAARSVLVVDEDPKDPECRVLASVKCNLAATPPSFSFRLDVAPGALAPRVLWLGPSSETADSLAASRNAKEADNDGETRTEEVQGLLEGWLGAGKMERGVVLKLARQAGFSDRTVERAAKNLGVQHSQRGYGEDKRSWWSLPMCAGVGEIEGVGGIGDLQRLTTPSEPAIPQSRQGSAFGEIGEKAGAEVFI